MKKYLLKLYITRNTEDSEKAIANLLQQCDLELKDDYELIVIDVLKQPQIAEIEKIFVTPTLIKEVPLPMQRIIGDMSDPQKIFLMLEILPKNHQISSNPEDGN